MMKMKTLYFVLAICVLSLVCIILALDRFNLFKRYHQLGQRIKDKTLLLDELQKKSEADANNARLEKFELLRRFTIVTEVRTPGISQQKKDDRMPQTEPSAQDGKQTPEMPFAQTSAEPAVSTAAKKLAARVETPVPAQIALIFEQYLRSPEHLSDALCIHSDGVRVTDRNAAVLENLCSLCGLEAESAIIWNMSSLNRMIRTKISVPAANADPGRKEAKIPEPVILSFAAGGLKSDNADFSPDSDSVVVQSSPVSVILPFDTVALKKDAVRNVCLDLHQIPVGGLYLHRIRFVCEDKSERACFLQYQLPPAPEKIVNPDGSEIPGTPWALNAVSLKGKKVVCAVSGNLRSFRIPLVNGTAEVLVFGDRAVLPLKISAAPASMTADKIFSGSVLAPAPALPAPAVHAEKKIAVPEK